MLNVIIFGVAEYMKANREALTYSTEYHKIGNKFEENHNQVVLIKLVEEKRRKSKQFP